MGAIKLERERLRMGSLSHRMVILFLILTALRSPVSTYFEKLALTTPIFGVDPLTIVDKRKVFLILIALSLLATPIPAQRVEMLILPPIISISFAGDSSAWVMTYAGDLFITADGGRTWKEVKAKTVKGFHYTSFIDPITGWAINQDGGIWSSNDGGLTWAKLSTIDSWAGLSITMVTDNVFTFFGASQGLIIRVGVNRRTQDGGRTWQRRLNPIANDSSFSILRWDG